MANHNKRPSPRPKRNHKIIFRVSAEERQAIEANAAANGMYVAEYIRACCIGEDAPVVIEEE